MKVILVILDGLSDQIAKCSMNYLLTECRARKGSLQHIHIQYSPHYSQCNTEPIVSEESLFHQIKSLGKRSAAVASHWITQIYNQTPFEPADWQFIADPSLTIPYGIFYFDWHYPNSHIISDGEYLRNHYNPDFLLIHLRELENDPTSPALYGTLLAQYLPQWIEDQYQVFITTDLILNHHNEILSRYIPMQIKMPLFVFGHYHQQRPTKTIQQADINSMICQILENP